MSSLDITLEFSGGAELLFDKVKKHKVTLPVQADEPWTLRRLLAYIGQRLVKERPELLLHGDSVRPGILVLVNDADWELCGELDRRDWQLVLQCEWGECTELSDTMPEFTAHVRLHIQQAVDCSTTSDHQTSLVCRWCDCLHSMEGGAEELTRHALFHAFHVKLKSIGMSYIIKGRHSMCRLDAHSRNLIPDLPERFHCGWSSCEVVCDNPEFFYEHVRGHSEDYPVGKDVVVVCKCLWQGCHGSFKTRHQLQLHLHSHTQEKSIACPTCGNLFASVTKFKDHLERQDQTLSSYQCSHCNKCFQNERLLRDHMRKHVSNYKCPFCDMTVAAPSQLRMHIKYRHTDDREFRCKVCNKGFKTERDIERHEKSKHEHVVLNCPHAACSYTCQHHFQLTCHLSRVHDQGGRTKYVCHMCDAQYQRGRTLTVHLMRHHGFRWMPGHRKFKYNRGEDGMYRLQTVRYESYELTRQMHEEGVNKALNGLNSQQQRRLEQRAASESSDARNSAETAASSGVGGAPSNSMAPIPNEAVDMVSGPLDLSSPSPSREVHCPAKDAVHITKSQQGGSPVHDTYNLQMLGDVALSSSEENSPQKQITQGRYTRSKARKSLEDTINSLRNSPQKSWHVKGGVPDRQSANVQSANVTDARSAKFMRNNRKRTTSKHKYGVARKKIKMEDRCYTYSLGSDGPIKSVSSTVGSSSDVPPCTTSALTCNTPVDKNSSSRATKSERVYPQSTWSADRLHGIAESVRINNSPAHVTSQESLNAIRSPSLDAFQENANVSAQYASKDTYWCSTLKEHVHVSVDNPPKENKLAPPHDEQESGHSRAYEALHDSTHRISQASGVAWAHGESHDSVCGRAVKSAAQARQPECTADPRYNVLQMQDGQMILVETNVPQDSLNVVSELGADQRLPEGARVIASGGALMNMPHNPTTATFMCSGSASEHC